MDRAEDVEQWLARKLWGYPDLVKEFHSRVRPFLAEARNKRINREGEMEEGQDMTTDHAVGCYPLEVVGQDRENSAFYPTQSSTLLDDGARPSGIKRINAQPCNPAQPAHPHPPPDEHHPVTASRNTEALGSAPRGTTMFTDVPDIKDVCIVINEIEEVLPTQENDEGLHTAQRKEKSGVILEAVEGYVPFIFRS